MVARTLNLPNVRRLFTPDDGMIIGEADLDRADLQVVVWESDDAELKQMLREGVDIHSENARTIGFSRDMAKRFVHATNYGSKPRTVASTCGITIKEAELAQKRWFDAHPGIKQWHERTWKQLPRVVNAFGYHIIFFERIDDAVWRNALAWTPQSTVGLVTNRALCNIDEQLPWCELLLQCHDSLVFQFPDQRLSDLSQIHEQLHVTVPYEDPLTIPWGIKLSRQSWGDCVDEEAFR